MAFRRAALLVVASAAAACGIDALGTGVGPGSEAGAPSIDATIGDDGALVDAGVETAPDALATMRATCKEIHVAAPLAPDGEYTVDPDGPGAGAPTLVRCDMTTAGGGWTLVGRELAGSTGQFRYLAADSMNEGPLAAGAASGLIGTRFIGKYTDVAITWNTASYIRFSLPPSYDLFANTLDTSVGVSNEATSEAALAGWFNSGNGAQLCVASRMSDVRPGDTSWAIKARDDNNNGCGCNSTAWVGRGAYYGGTVDGQQSTCIGWGGGWAGVKDNGAQKGGIVPTYETLIWIR
jgi:hypothetical protein